MCDDSSRQGGKEKNVPQIEVTPEMIEAGKQALIANLGGDSERATDWYSEAAADVFKVMLSVSRPQSEQG